VIPALIAVAALTALSACAPVSDIDPSASATPTVPISTNLDAITVTGERLKTPTVEFAAPFAVDKTMTKVLVEGDGQAIDPNGIAVAFYYGVNGRTGERFDDNFTSETEGVDPTPAPFPLKQVVPGFRLGLGDQKIGSRVLIAMPGSEGYDEMGGNTSAGIALGDTLVFVVDITDGSLLGPEGKTITPPADLPKVAETDGKVTITIPDTAPPKELVTQVLIEGAGAKLTPESVLISHYVFYSWNTKSELKRVYEEVDMGVLNTAIQGLATGLEGKTVGSRVLLIIPPDQAFPDGSNDPPVEPGDTMVFVVDLLMAL
jgi:peptidylprolyl isomerase